MPLPLIAGLNAAARAALPIIQGGVSKNMSSRAISAAIKTAFGKSIARGTLLSIIRAEKGVERQSQFLKFISRIAIPNVRRLPRALTKLRRNYAFIVRVTGVIAGTGETIIQRITIATDTAKSREELENMARDVINKNQSSYPIEIVESLLERGVQAGDLGVL